MKVLVNPVGVVNREKEVMWPEGWPIPTEGDSIEIDGLPEVDIVRLVVWYPEGNDDIPEPFVYIVIGPRRPSSREGE